MPLEAKIGVVPAEAAIMFVLTNAFLAENVPAFDFQIFLTKLPLEEMVASVVQERHKYGE